MTPLRKAKKTLAKKLQQAVLNTIGISKLTGRVMIEVTRINDQKIIINADLIEFIEVTPDTIITTTTGKKILVLDSVKDIIIKVIKYRRDCFPFKRIKPVKNDVVDGLTDYYESISKS